MYMYVPISELVWKVGGAMAGLSTQLEAGCHCMSKLPVFDKQWLVKLLVLLIDVSVIFDIAFDTGFTPIPRFREGRL